jgi:predicted RNase H-like nuclease (RuvC/YqgF family)
VQGTIDGMKRDLKDKDRLIEQKNREIVKLRMENDEYKSNFENVDSLVVSQHQRNKIVNEMESVVDTLKLELERTKRSLFKDES